MFLFWTKHLWDSNLRPCRSDSALIISRYTRPLVSLGIIDVPRVFHFFKKMQFFLDFLTTKWPLPLYNYFSFLKPVTLLLKHSSICFLADLCETRTTSSSVTFKSHNDVVEIFFVPTHEYFFGVHQNKFPDEIWGLFYTSTMKL